MQLTAQLIAALGLLGSCAEMNTEAEAAKQDSLVKFSRGGFTQLWDLKAMRLGVEGGHVFSTLIDCSGQRFICYTDGSAGFLLPRNCDDVSLIPGSVWESEGVRARLIEERSEEGEGYYKFEMNTKEVGLREGFVFQKNVGVSAVWFHEAGQEAETFLHIVDPITLPCSNNSQ